MPRNLARLRFRTPKPVKPLNLSPATLKRHDVVERKVLNHVLKASRPAAPLSLQIVVNPRWNQQPGDKPRILQRKPHTLRDLVDPQREKEHGQIIYIFKNTRTKQVIYSLAELLAKHHLEQLPFMGKHTKPPELRPDEWAPHCVVSFPTAAQGLHAFRKLREFRKLHELSWDKTHPQWIKLTAEKRMKKIMNQVAFTSADLAAVLSKQHQQSEWMENSIQEQVRNVSHFMSKKWPEIDALAEASLAKDKKDGDNTKWLEHQIRRMDYQLAMKHNQNDKDQARLKTAKRSHEARLKKILYAQRKSEQRKDMKEKLETAAAPANEAGAEERLATLKREVALLEEELDNPTEKRKADDIALDKDTIKDHRVQIAALEKAFKAKKMAEEGNDPISLSILPPPLKKTLPVPFTMDIDIKWADLLDAEYARGKWPAAITHDVLPLRAQREAVQFLSAEEYDATVEGEVVSLVNQLTGKAVGESEPLEAVEAPKEEKTGISKYLPSLKNPFKRAEA